MFGSLIIAVVGLTGPAFAQDSSERPRMDVLAGFRGVGEIWQDAAIVENYRSSRFSGAGFASFGITSWLSSEIELGYMRTMADSGRSIIRSGETVGQVAGGALELVPVTLSLVASKDLGAAEAFWGGGFAMAVFSERTDAGTVSGAKPGFDLHTGVRVHTSFVQPSFRPDKSVGASGVDIELMVGRRQHQAFGTGVGFDFSAWRIGAGVVARF